MQTYRLAHFPLCFEFVYFAANKTFLPATDITSPSYSVALVTADRVLLVQANLYLHL